MEIFSTSWTDTYEYYKKSHNDNQTNIVSTKMNRQNIEVYVYLSDLTIHFGYKT